jgi:hypothetical protein
MIYMTTTSQVAPSSLIRIMENRIQGKVRIIQRGHVYFFQCQPTSHYDDLLSFIQHQDGFPLLVDGNVFVLKMYTSKL